MKEKNLPLTLNEAELLRNSVLSVMQSIEAQFGNDFDLFPVILQENYLSYGSALAKLRDLISTFES